jgi:HAMP domain-containing protein
MSDDDVQSYANHARWFPPWHFFAIPVLVINVIVHLVRFIREPVLTGAWTLVVAIALVTGLICARWMPLRVQDRLIRLEETLRLERLMPDRAMDIERLTPGQLIGIRFASDAEVEHLLDRIMAGDLATRGDVKRAIQHWRSDHLRA